MNKKVIIVSVIIILFMIAVIFAVPAIIMWLYNGWLGGLLGIASLTYSQAFALWILCGILFKSPNYTDEDIKKKIYSFLDEITEEDSSDQLEPDTASEEILQ